MPSVARVTYIPLKALAVNVIAIYARSRRKRRTLDPTTTVANQPTTSLARANNPAKRRDNGSLRNPSWTCEKSLKSSAGFSAKARRSLGAPRQRGRHREHHVHQLHRTNAPRARADDLSALLRLILRRVRQRAFVIQNPYVIPRVEIAAANVASEKVFGLANAPPVGALADHRPAWSRFFE
jgi:hypothetical protein